MASNIVTVNVSIKGTRPLLWHRFGPDALPLEKKERTGVPGNDPQEWHSTFTSTEDGKLYMPGTYAFSALVEGARYTRKGRGNLQKSVAATLNVISDRLIVDRDLPADILTDPDKYYNEYDEPVYIDVRGVRNPASKGRNIRYRIASSPGWETSFTITFDKTIVSREEIHTCLIDTGRLVGLADARSIGMGRFDIVSFEEVKKDA